MSSTAFGLWDKNMKTTLTILALSVMAIANAAPSFTPIGDLPGGEFQSSVSDLSKDGLWVIGSSRTTFDYDQKAMRWSLATGMINMGDLPGGGTDAGASSTNFDGSIIVGWGTTTSGQTGFTWTPGNGMSPLAEFPGGAIPHVRSLSLDGSTIVGNMYHDGLYKLVRWVNGVPEYLGQLSNAHWLETANAVSDDGSVIFGDAAMPDTLVAFRWTAQTGLQPLPSPFGYKVYSAEDCSGDGRFAVGRAKSTQGDWYAFRWEQGVGTTIIPGLDNGSHVSNDGKIVAGYSNNLATIWDPINGARDLRTVLLQQGASGLATWELRYPRGMTIVGDEIVIAGDGTNPNGQSEGWVARIRRPHQYMTGQVFLPDVASLANHVVTFEVRTVGHNQVLGTYAAVLDAAGRYRFETELPIGTYDLTAKASHWLRQLAAEVEVSGSGGGANFSLINGDCDRDNEVGIGDYAVLSSQFGWEKVDGGDWDGKGDLNEDDVVDVADYAILSANFGLVGDE